MKIRKVFIVFLLIILPVGFVQAQEKTSSASSILAECNKENKYLFAFFFEDEKESNTREMLKIFDEAKSILKEKAEFIKIDILDKTEKKFVKDFEVNKIAKPAILAIAPGNIVTKGFIRNVKLEELEQAFVTPKTLEVLKANKKKKLIVLLFSNDNLENAKKAKSIVNSVINELSDTTAMQLIIIDPNDKNEKALLEQAKVSQDTKRPVVIVMQDGAIKGTIESDKLTTNKLAELISSICETRECGPGG